jgi:hypothetical protein
MNICSLDTRGEGKLPQRVASPKTGLRDFHFKHYLVYCAFLAYSCLRSAI